MEGWEIFLLILVIIVILGGIVVAILAVAGVFEEENLRKKTEKILQGFFSFHSLNNNKSFVTVSSSVSSGGSDESADGKQLVVSNSSVVPCKDYEWKYINDDTIEWGGDLSGSGSERLVITASSSTSGADIILQKKGTPGSLNQWVFNFLDFTWCLKSNPKLCIFNKGGNLTLENLSINEEFVWVPVDAITPPTCS